MKPAAGRVAALLGLGAAAAALPVVSHIRVRRAEQPLTDRWRELAVEPRGSTLLGFSFRPAQAEAMGLAPVDALGTLLGLPFDVVRLAARWKRLEPLAGRFVPADLDWQVEQAERAGKRIVLCTGAVKAFGYPDWYVPEHRGPLREGGLIGPDEDAALLDAAVGFVGRVVERYRDRPSIVAWQVEHEPADPLGFEHSWRLAESFVAAEVAAVRAADPTRPRLVTGFLPASLPARLSQRWRTRDQGDSLQLAERLADLVGLDVYPRLGLLRLGPWTAYIDGSGDGGQRRLFRRLVERVTASGRGWLVSEGQAEPWETVTTPPDPAGRAMSSCRPEHLVETYNSCLRLGRAAGSAPFAYLFWGAEYWLRRAAGGDPTYLRAAERVLDCA